MRLPCLVTAVLCFASAPFAAESRRVSKPRTKAAHNRSDVPRPLCYVVEDGSERENAWLFRDVLKCKCMKGYHVSGGEQCHANGAHSRYFSPEALAGLGCRCMRDAPKIRVLAADNLFCSELKDIQFRGRNPGPYLQLVCENWPAAWGTFPAKTVLQANGLVDFTFKDGGIYDQVKNMVGERLESGAFCWKSNLERFLIEPERVTCPDVFYFEPSLQVEPKNASDGAWTCEKPCHNICGSSINLGEAHTKFCKCRSTYRPVMNAGPRAPWELRERVIPATYQGCGAVRHGKCYSECPAGYEPSYIMGRFLPVCTTSCAHTGKPANCGFGCATSAEECSNTVAEQVGQVVSTVGKTVSFLTGNPGLALTVDALASVVTFAFTVVRRIVSQVVTALWGKSLADQKAAVLTALLGLVAGEDFKGSLQELRGHYAEFLKLMGEIATAFASWKLSTIKELTESVLARGVGGIVQIYKVLQAFVWPSCNTATTSEVPLTRTTAGQEVVSTRRMVKRRAKQTIIREETRGPANSEAAAVVRFPAQKKSFTASDLESGKVDISKANFIITMRAPADIPKLLSYLKEKYDWEPLATIENLSMVVGELDQNQIIDVLHQIAVDAVEVDGVVSIVEK